MANHPPLQDPDEEGRKDRLQPEADPEAAHAVRILRASYPRVQGAAGGCFDVLSAVHLDAIPFPHELRNRNPAVVVADPTRHAAEELESPLTSRLKRLGAIPGEDLHEERIAIRQRHHAVSDFRRRSLQHHLRFAEVELRFARPMRKRQEDFHCGRSPLPHDLADHRDPTGVAVLGTQSVKDSFGSVALLAGRRFILLQDLMDEWQEWIELEPLPGLPLPIAGRLRVLQDLFESLPMDGNFPANPSAPPRAALFDSRLHKVQFQENTQINKYAK